MVIWQFVVVKINVRYERVCRGHDKNKRVRRDLLPWKKCKNKLVTIKM